MKRIINLTLNAAFCPLVSSYRYRVTNVLANMTKINGDEHHIKLERSESAMLQTAKSMCISTQMSNSTAIMQTLVATTAVRQINKNIKINLIAPYFPYTQQDRFIKGGSFTLKLCCDLFNAQKYNSILIMDPHSNVTSAL
ncbi:MAG: ribose-phosphate pyrophosphokinase, partial [Harvfovirus sp.]